MANEISITTTMQVTNGNFKQTIAPGRLQFTQAAIGGGGKTVSIGTSEETYTDAELTTDGFCYMQNLDPTNYVEWGFSTGVYGGKMEPGEPAGPFRLVDTTTLYLKANTAACNVLIYVFED